MGLEREIIFYKDYFIEFYNSQNSNVQEKIEYVFVVIQSIYIVPTKFLKHISSTDGLYEIRIEVGTNIFRIFCFFDNKNVVVLLNAFQKKSQKIPHQQLDIAKRLQKQYFEENGTTRSFRNQIV